MLEFIPRRKAIQQQEVKQEVIEEPKLNFAKDCIEIELMSKCTIRCYPDGQQRVIRSSQWVIGEAKIINKETQKKPKEEVNPEVKAKDEEEE